MYINANIPFPKPYGPWIALIFSTQNLTVWNPCTCNSLIAKYSLGTLSVGGLVTPYNSCNWSGSWYDNVVNTVSFTTEFGLPILYTIVFLKESKCFQPSSESEIKLTYKFLLWKFLTPKIFELRYMINCYTNSHLVNNNMITSCQ